MILSRINEIDHSLSLAINLMNEGGGLDYVARLFSNVQIWIPMYIIIVGFMFWRLGWKRGLVALVALILCVICCDQMANLFKNSVMRLRPCYDPWMIEHGIHNIPATGGGKYGFYSAHAANTIGFAICSLKLFLQDHNPRASRYYRAYGEFIFLWATLVCISRIICAKHFLGDVLVGAIMGFITGWGLAYLAEITAKKIKNL